MEARVCFARLRSTAVFEILSCLYGAKKLIGGAGSAALENNVFEGMTFAYQQHFLSHLALCLSI